MRKKTENFPSSSVILSSMRVTIELLTSTRSRTKQLDQQMHSLVNTNLILTNQIISDHLMLLSTCLNVLRNDGVRERAWDEDDFCPPKLW